MYLREATLSDVPMVSGVGIRAFNGDPLIAILEPGRHTFKEDYEAGWELRIRSEVLKPEARIILVADEETGVIAGFAVWQRRGDDPAVYRWRNEGGILKRIERTLLDFEMKILNFLRKSRSEDAAIKSHFQKSSELVATGTWASHGCHMRWHLKMLAVDPAWQRKGLGTMLVRWGMDNSAKEGVVCCLQASPIGKLLYDGLGFKIVGLWEPFKGLGEEYKHIIAPMMVWEPENARLSGVANGAAKRVQQGG